MAYREDSTVKRPTAVVHYRPMNIVASVAITAVLLLMCAFTYFQAWTFLRATELSCVRGGEHSCTILRHYGPFTTHEVVPINDIHSVSIKSHTSKNSTTYSTIFLLKDTSKIQLTRPGPVGIADATKLAVEKAAFDREPGTTTLHIQDPAPFSPFFFALIATGLGALSLVFTRTARLEFDLDRGTIAYTRVRWPLRPVRRRFRAEEVKRARVVARPGSKGATIYEVALVIEGEPDLVLIAQGGGSEKRHEEKAAEINGHLARLHEEHVLT